jgi:hypothetical protein
VNVLPLQANSGVNLFLNELLSLKRQVRIEIMREAHKMSLKDAMLVEKFLETGQRKLPTSVKFSDTLIELYEMYIDLSNIILNCMDRHAV